MTINPDLFVVAPMLQDYFVDKDTGTPLAGGIVTFYQDNARTILKNVYYQSLNPTNGLYDYFPLDNPCTLTSVGTIADPGGNDVIPYWYPWDENDETTSQPYYITVYSSVGVEQFTRDNFPYVASNSPGPGPADQELINYIPNAQFSAHTDVPGNIYPNAGGSIVVAPGGANGWQYLKNNESTDTDELTFTYITQDPPSLTGNARWAFTTDVTQSSGSPTTTERYLGVTFQNVNLFGSPTDSPTTYTFSFQGQSNTSGTVSLDLILYKNFGSGGSTQQEIFLETLVCPSDEYETFNISFTFGSNSGYTIGPNNDDYIGFVLSYPLSGDFSVSVTNFVLTPGVVDITQFPQQPDNMVFANGIAGSMPIPNSDGSDLYLPIIYTPTGFSFDNSHIGSIESSFNPSPGISQLVCDGSQYQTDEYSSVGIPYNRLFNILYNNANFGGIPLFGTGINFVTVHPSSGETNIIYLSSNSANANSTPAANGTPSTGFTFATVSSGQTSEYPFIASLSASNGITIRNNVVSASMLTAPAQTTSLTINTIQNEQGSPQIINVSGFAVGSSVTAGEYFRFYIQGGSYYVWYKVAGSGSDPAPGGTGIEVDLTGNELPSDVTYKTLVILQGGFLSDITCVGSVAAGAYFSFEVNDQNYVVWYTVNGAGTKPSVAGASYIPVNLVANTVGEVITNTVIAVNSYMFAVPNLQGMWLRGIDPTGIWDSGSRISFGNNTISGLSLGTAEYDAIQSHNHTVPQGSSGTGNYCGPSGVNPGNVPTSFYGQPETRVINTSVYFYINY